ncbi:MAG: hypothetical protein HKN83_08315, partial [Gammaproteobacteria bacterium]|nr:hypothetical protein [Gammaproteobacteria bacterium]
MQIKKLLFLYLLLSVSSAEATKFYRFSAESDANIGDTSIPNAKFSEGRNDCMIFTNGIRQPLNIGTPSDDILPSGNGENSAYPNLNGTNFC